MNTLKKKHPVDYTILRNAVISAFKQEGHMDYASFVESIFEHYIPEDETLSKKLPSIIQKLKKLPENKKFDTMFTLIPSEVPFRRSKFSLTKEISLSVDDGIENIDQKIWSEETIDGKKLVVIDSPDGFKFFTKKERTK